MRVCAVFSAVLGFHSMLTQTQYHASLRDEKLEDGGFTGMFATYCPDDKIVICPSLAVYLNDNKACSL